MKNSTRFKMLKYMFLWLIFESTYAEKECLMTSTRISCNGLTFDSESNTPLSIDQSDLKGIDLSGHNLGVINNTLLQSYKNLKELKLANCGIRQIETDAFRTLHELKYLDLSNNFLTNFNSKTFETYSNLMELILSNNIITNLNDLVIKDFPKLRTLDISNNRLTYLPINIMEKLLEPQKFILISYGNSWNCNHSNFQTYIKSDEIIRDVFCETRSSFASADHNGEQQRTQTIKKRPKCQFINCIYWIIGGLWIGIILGNLNKLRNMLVITLTCRKPKPGNLLNGKSLINYYSIENTNKNVLL